jgi:hypothetical protein
VVLEAVHHVVQLFVLGADETKARLGRRFEHCGYRGHLQVWIATVADLDPQVASVVSNRRAPATNSAGFGI